MAIVSITSNEGAVEFTSAVLEVTATNPEYNQPALHVKQASKRGGAASIRIDNPGTGQKCPLHLYTSECIIWPGKPYSLSW